METPLEKLIPILSDYFEVGCNCYHYILERVKYAELTAKDFRELDDDDIAEIAEYLIAEGVTVQRWIPVSERLPEEHDSVFKQFAGTEHWAEGMPMAVSDTVLAVVEYESGKRKVQALHTQDGHFHIGTLYKAKRVTHWMPLPEPPKEE